MAGFRYSFCIIAAMKNLLPLITAYCADIMPLTARAPPALSHSRTSRH